MDFWKEYEIRLKKAKFPQQFYDVQKRLFSKMAVRNFIKMYPEEWGGRINASQDNIYDKGEVETAHKIASNLYDEILIRQKIAKEQRKSEERSRKMKITHDQQLTEIRYIGRDRPHDDIDNWQIRGSVIDKDSKQPIEGLAVKAFDVNHLHEKDYLGKTRTTALGTFCIRFQNTDLKNVKSQNFNKSKPEYILKVYDTNGELIHMTKNKISATAFMSVRIELPNIPNKRTINLSNIKIAKKDPRLCLSDDEIKTVNNNLLSLTKICKHKNSGEQRKFDLDLEDLETSLKAGDIDVGLYAIDKIMSSDDLLGNERKEIDRVKSSIRKMRNYRFPENYYRYRFCIDRIQEQILLEQLKASQGHWTITINPWINLINTRIELSKGHKEFLAGNFNLAIKHYENSKNLLILIPEIQEFREHQILVYRSKYFIGPLINRRLTENIFTLCELSETLWQDIFNELPEPMKQPRLPEEYYPYNCKLYLERIIEGEEEITFTEHADIYMPLEFGMNYVSSNFPYMIVLHLFLIDLAIAEANIELGNYDIGINQLLNLVGNEYINIPIEQNYIRCHLMRAYLLKADLHYRREEKEFAIYAYERIFSVYKQSGSAIADEYKLEIEIFEEEIVDLSQWHEDDQKIFKNYTENPVALRYIHAAAMRLQQLKFNLNFLGYDDDYIPIWSYEYLDLQTRNLINIAQRHEAEYLDFIKEREKQHELIRSLEQQYFIAKAEQSLAKKETDYTRSVFNDLNRQYNAYGSASELDNSKLFGAFNELSVKSHQKINDDLTADQFDRMASSVSISFPGELGVSISPSGLVGLITSNIRYSASKELQTSQLDYEKVQLLMQRENISEQVILSAAQIDIARAKEKIAEYRVDVLNNDLRYHRNKTLSEEFWWQAAQQARDFVIWYIEKANLVAFLAEQAYEYENDLRVNVIRYDYSKAQFGEIYGADQLLRDLDTIRLANIETAKKEVQIKHIISLREQHPFLLENFQSKGKVGFTTLLTVLDFAYPGFYKTQIKALEVKIIGLLPQRGIKGAIRNIGHSLIRSRSSNKSKGYLHFDETRDELFDANGFNYWSNGFPDIDWYHKTNYRINGIDFEGEFRESPIEVYYFLYSIEVLSDEIVFGGNKHGVNTKAKYPYFVIVPGDVNVKVVPEAHAKVIKIEKNVDGSFKRDTLRIYSDRYVEIVMGRATSVSVLNDAWIIQTKYSDLENSEANLLTLSFTRADNSSVKRPITILVAYDARSKSLPHWLCPYEINTRLDLEETMVLSSYDFRHDGVVLSGDTNKKGVFEGVGYGTRWELDVPRTENKFNYSTVFDIQISFYLKAYYDAALAERINAAKNRLYAKSEYTKRNITFSLKMDFPDMYYHLKNEKRIATLKDSLTNLAGIGGAVCEFKIKESHCPFKAGDFIFIDNEIMRIKSVDDNCIKVAFSISRGGIGNVFPPGSRKRTTYFATRSGHHESGAAIYALPLVYLDALDSFFPHNEKGPNSDIDRTLWNMSFYFSFKKEFTYPSDYDTAELRDHPIPVPFYLAYANDTNQAPIERSSNLLYAVRKEETIGDAPNKTAVTVPRNPKARLFSEKIHNEFFCQTTARQQLNPCAKYGIVFLLPNGLAVEDIEDLILNIEYSITPIL